MAGDWPPGFQHDRPAPTVKSNGLGYRVVRHATSPRSPNRVSGRFVDGHNVGRPRRSRHEADCGHRMPREAPASPATGPIQLARSNDVVAGGARRAPMGERRDSEGWLIWIATGAGRCVAAPRSALALYVAIHCCVASNSPFGPTPIKDQRSDTTSNERGAAWPRRQIRRLIAGASRANGGEYEDKSRFSKVGDLVCRGTRSGAPNDP